MSLLTHLAQAERSHTMVELPPEWSARMENILRLHGEQATLALLDDLLDLPVGELPQEIEKRYEETAASIAARQARLGGQPANQPVSSIPGFGRFFAQVLMFILLGMMIIYLLVWVHTV